jgi:hypothetical protein
MASTAVEEERLAPSDLRHKSIFTQRINRTILVTIAVAAISISAFVYFFTNGMTNVYGDGIAHVNIARKVIDSSDDSLRQRYIQIGSPWLPVQTVLMLPLVTNDWMWRTGAAGSIVSMIAFVVAALVLYRLAQKLYRAEDSVSQKALPVLALAIFLLNPSVLYLQTTPMSELVFMAALVVAVYLLQCWRDDQTFGRLASAAISMSVATLTRYEAWPVALVSVLIVTLAASGGWKNKIKAILIFSSLVALCPIYWLWHNWEIYGNALEFLSGPNSARGIALQNRVNFNWSAIFVGHPGLDFLTMAAATSVCAGPVVFTLGVTGFARSVVAKRKSLLEYSPLILLILPFLFEVFGLYRGEIQIIPISALGLLNVRYGLPHMLGVALFAPATLLLFKPQSRRLAVIVFAAIVAGQYLYLISEGPSQLAIYQEGHRNGVNAKPVRERTRVSTFLKTNPPEKMILMHTGALGPLVSQGGFCFADTIHEGTGRWHQLGDGIPDDVMTVVVQQGDPLDLRFQQEASLIRDLSAEFTQRFSAGNITVYERIKEK